MQGLCVNSKVYYHVSLLISHLNVTSLGIMQDHVLTFLKKSVFWSFLKAVLKLLKPFSDNCLVFKVDLKVREVAESIFHIGLIQPLFCMQYDTVFNYMSVYHLVHSILFSFSTEHSCFGHMSGCTVEETTVTLCFSKAAEHKRQQIAKGEENKEKKVT